MGVTAYTTAQQAAIGCVDSHVEMIACAGSGKTEVISQPEAGNALRTNVLPRHTHWCSHCANCDLSALCRRKS